MVINYACTQSPWKYIVILKYFNGIIDQIVKKHIIKWKIKINIISSDLYSIDYSYTLNHNRYVCL